MNRHYMTAILAASMALLVPLQSCDDDGDETSTSSLCESYCDQLVDCAGQIVFDDIYNSMGDCEDECSEEIDDVMEVLGGDCESLYREYLACVYNLSCQDLEDEYESAGDECDNEWYALVDECDAEDPNEQCTEDSVNDCYSAYEVCTEYLDPESSSYLDDLQECLDDYCDCLTAAGCDMSGYDCGS